ncbi:MAG: NAD-dependent epimerase/dehydratase family protein [Coriobacteriia bacterium]|nr:NAD-dependent epimerase/dehydratase family protein [Coriobacteriia bacterium]
MLIKDILQSKDIQEIISWELPWGEFRGKTILVTGASGMIPSYVVYTLLALNDEHALGLRVLALVRNEKKACALFGKLLDREDIKLLVQDVCKPVVVSEAIDLIIHGGSPARPSAHASAPTDTLKANLVGTLNLLDLAVQKGSQAFVLMSSSEVYGTVSSELDKIQEDDYGFIDILNSRSCYSEGKRAAETICAAYNAQFNITCRMPRFGHVYGPGLALDDGRVQADFAANVLRGEDIVLQSDGSSIRSYTYVSDAVAGLFFVLLKGTDSAYNIADSEGSVSIRQLAEAFASARPEKGLKVSVQEAKSNDRSYNPASFIALDDSRLRCLGWEPRVTLQKGVDRMLSYYEALNL